MQHRVEIRTPYWPTEDTKCYLRPSHTDTGDFDMCHSFFDASIRMDGSLRQLGRKHGQAARTGLHIAADTILDYNSCTTVRGRQKKSWGSSSPTQPTCSISTPDSSPVVIVLVSSHVTYHLTFQQQQKYPTTVHRAPDHDKQVPDPLHERRQLGGQSLLLI